MPPPNFHFKREHRMTGSSKGSANEHIPILFPFIPCGSRSLPQDTSSSLFPLALKPIILTDKKEK
jgi:hypothetical protein